MTDLDTWLKSRADRCSGCGYAEIQGCSCEGSDWSTFVSALRSVRREDGTVHQGDMRPKIRGVIQPSKIGQLYRKARDGGLIADTGEREPSNDAAGRNLDKLDRIYRWVDAA